MELVKSAKILGMLITDDLKWNSHIENTVSKASKRLYLLRQLKRADVEESSLLQFYTACIRSILEYGCQVLHSSLPDYLSMDLERVQRRALKIRYPELNLKEAIKQAKMPTTLKNRREKLSQKLSTSIQENREHKLYHLLPEGNSQTYNFRELRRYKLPIINTYRLKNSYIFKYASQSKLYMARYFGHALDHNQFAQCQNLQLCCELL